MYIRKNRARTPFPSIVYLDRPFTYDDSVRFWKLWIDQGLRCIQLCLCTEQRAAADAEAIKAIQLVLEIQ
jgi:hypothetical protein